MNIADGACRRKNINQIFRHDYTIRAGNPVDEEEDYALNVWAGVFPLKLKAKRPIADRRLKSEIEIPDYIEKILTSE